MAVEQYMFTLRLTNATTNAVMTDFYDASQDFRLTVTAANGYYFAVAPYFYYIDAYGDVMYQTMKTDETGDYKSDYYFDLTAEYLLRSEFEGEITVIADGQVKPEVDKYGIITMYNPTPQELRQIGAVRYYSGDQIIDLGNFITSLLKVFVKIPKGNKAEVLLGGYHTDVECNSIVNDVVETDCGTIEITGRYHNAMDYENTTVEIYLPLIGFKELETEKVMNETLSLIYRTNVINGDSIACIYNTTGTLIYTFNCKASFEIPYYMNEQAETKGNVEVNSNYLFGFTPFVTIRYNKAYNAANAIANDDRETTLEHVQGYIKCSEVFNTIAAPTTEKDEIDDLLKTGVIFS